MGFSVYVCVIHKKPANKGGKSRDLCGCGVFYIPREMVKY